MQVAFQAQTYGGPSTGAGNEQVRSHLSQQISPPVPEIAPWAPAWDADTSNHRGRPGSAEAGPSSYGLVPTTSVDHGVNTIDDILRELGFDANSFSTPGHDLNQTALSLDMEQMQAALGKLLSLGKTDI